MLSSLGLAQPSVFRMLLFYRSFVESVCSILPSGPLPSSNMHGLLVKMLYFCIVQNQSNMYRAHVALLASLGYLGADADGVAPPQGCSWIEANFASIKLSNGHHLWRLSDRRAFCVYKVGMESCLRALARAHVARRCPTHRTLRHADYEQLMIISCELTLCPGSRAASSQATVLTTGHTPCVSPRKARTERLPS